MDNSSQQLGCDNHSLLPIGVNSWCHSTAHNSACKVIEEQTLFGQVVCRVWLPGSDTVVKVPKSSLKPLDDCQTSTNTKNSSVLIHRISALAAAGRVADAIATYTAGHSDGVLLAPMESAVTPLPHQISALKRAIAINPSRFLLADEVGLGKTIEAGLIMRELRLRGIVKRVLIVVPTGLVRQWISEMKTHFNEQFNLFLPREMESFSNFFQAVKDRLDIRESVTDSGDFNPWLMSDNVICPMDAIKPINRRKGWTKQEVDKYNAERFLRVINAGWDLVIIDEAHRIAGMDPTVARFKLGSGLGQATPHLLLLSATPHQGKTDAFFRLMNIIDEGKFPSEEFVTKNKVQPYLIRHEKRSVVNENGDLIFHPRVTRMINVEWQDRHSLQQNLYDGVTLYVREGYKYMERVVMNKRKAIGFLLVLMQRLVTSSTCAVRKTLERRLNILEHPEIGDEAQVNLLDPDELDELDGDAQLDAVIPQNNGLEEFEKEHVRSLLELARKAESQSQDAKAEQLMGIIYDLQAEQKDPGLKVLIFTEFTATQEMLCEFLSARGLSTVLINGSMDMDERQMNQKRFAEDVRILISTEAGGEGLNLQFCHIVINYDLPWNPMRIEQRIGRVDRIGQKKDVLAMNLMLDGTVESRVRQVLELKLQVILEELGIDKLGDVIDSGEAAQIFDKVYTDALCHPDSGNKVIDDAVSILRKKIMEVREYEGLYLSSTVASSKESEKYTHHPFPYWIERMTASFISFNGGDAQKQLSGWELRWPDGNIDRNVTFNAAELQLWPDAEFLSIGNPRIKSLLKNLLDKECLDCPVIKIKSLPETVEGVWALWRISASSAEWERHRVLPLFIHRNGKVFHPTAMAAWDELISGNFNVVSSKSPEFSPASIMSVAENSFGLTYEQLLSEFNSKRELQRQRQENIFQHRRKAISKVGIENIRKAKLGKLDQEESKWRNSLKSADDPLPELRLIMAVKIEGGSSAKE